MTTSDPLAKLTDTFNREHYSAAWNVSRNAAEYWNRWASDDAGVLAWHGFPPNTEGNATFPTRFAVAAFAPSIWLTYIEADDYDRFCDRNPEPDPEDERYGAHEHPYHPGTFTMIYRCRGCEQPREDAFERGRDIPELLHTSSTCDGANHTFRTLPREMRQ